MEQVRGGWENCPYAFHRIWKEAAELTSDPWLFPQVLPATASPLIAPNIPQPSGRGTQTRGLQGAERWGNHTGSFSMGSGKGKERSTFN